MAPLLFLIGILLVASGAIKARSSARLGLGTPVLGLLELAAALVLAAAATLGWAGAAGGFWLAAGGTALVLVSSVRHGLRVRAHRARREASEGRRLEAYVRYLSGSSEAGDV